MIRLAQIASSFACAAALATANAADHLRQGFIHPPASAFPWVYWFPLNGNITSNGITADLEAMARVGIGGALYMETEQGTPPGPAPYDSVSWHRLVTFACQEAHRLGLEINMNNDAGWCGSGGPWITPALSMQKVVWTQTEVSGPKHFDGVLPQPQAVRNYYRDIAVFAFPTPQDKFVIPQLDAASAVTVQEFPTHAVWPRLPAAAVTPRAQLLNLGDKMDADGRLRWDVPPGQWMLLRMGHTSTGVENHPAPKGGLGLESDKLSREATKVHFYALMQKLIDEVGPLASKTLVSTHIDSWETGSQNWTPSFREDFRRLRGYDPTPFLPVFAGRVVDSLEVSERFLWDVRMTVNDLLVENYAGYMRDLARKHGLRLSIEAYGEPADDLTYGGRADEPMGEFWSWSKYGAASSCIEMASVAHVYGKRILGAESFTADNNEKWQGHPASIKDLGDWAFCQGINRFVFHRYALQPWTSSSSAPGISMGPWGLHYERTQTWWEQSKAWHEYLARCQYLLQQGQFVADLCFLEPENSPQAFRSPVKNGIEHPGYNFDGCPPEVVFTRMRAKDGRIVLPDGMSYRMLVLPQTETMTPKLLRRIKELVEAGATVVGVPPEKSPSLESYPQCDEAVRDLAREVWGERSATDSPKTSHVHRLGKGRVLWTDDLLRQESSLPESSLPENLTTARWIWFAEGNPSVSAPPGFRYFRRLLVLKEPLQSARLTMTADNVFTCWANGKQAANHDDWKSTITMNLTKLLKPGTNIIAVLAENTTDSPTPAGLIAALSIKYQSGKTETVTTDSAWQASKTKNDDWQTGLPNNDWSTAMELGPYGMGPWGRVGEMPLAVRDPIPDINSIIPLLAQDGVPPDFSFVSSNPGTGLRFIHKAIGDTDVYFVANKNPENAEAACTFRIAGKRPEIWYPDTGRMEPAAAFETRDGVTTIPLRFEPEGSLFVVFRTDTKSVEPAVSFTRNGMPAGSSAELHVNAAGEFTVEAGQPGRYAIKTAGGRALAAEVAVVPPALDLSGPWKVSFEPNRGAPARATFDQLISWSESPVDGIKYFSGHATYRKRFEFNDVISKSTLRVYLELGKVEIVAEVRLNGKSLGILWKPPYRVDVTDALQKGTNELEVRVVNLWVNRMIGDEQLPEDSERNGDGTLKEWPQWLLDGKSSPTGRFSFTSWRLWKKNDPLVPSGLLGPVRLSTSVVRRLN
jgi:hypothetical protein